MKKNYLIIFIICTAFMLTACQYVQEAGTGQTSTEDMVVNPIILDVYVSDKGKVFDRTIEPLIDPEPLEAIYNFYGALDKEENLYRLIYNNVLTDYRIEGDVMSSENDTMSVNLINGGFAIDYTAFIKHLGLKTQSTDRLRLTIKDGASLDTALLTGTAYSDYTNTQAREFNEKKVQIVNIAEGYALVIADDKPYLTSESNLSNVQTFYTKTTKENNSVENTRKIVFAWDLYGNDEKMVLDKRVDVVIPKWLSLQNAQGDINDLFRPQYTANIKAQGAELWALVNNAFDPDLTSKMLNSAKARDNFTSQMIDYVKHNDVAGISLDFENMHLSDSDLYVQLSAELALKAKALDVPLGIAVTVPGGSDNWSLVYDRPRLGALADYIMLMAYDQHYAASDVAGPVAGYSWVDKNINKMLELVPREKLILGVPFYTRLWIESPSLTMPNHMKVKSKDVFMGAALSLVLDNQLTPVWDEENQQNYYVRIQDSAVQKFWYEGPVSVSIKTDLINKYNLPGVAYWSLGFETKEAWQKIIEKIGN